VGEKKENLEKAWGSGHSQKEQTGFKEGEGVHDESIFQGASQLTRKRGSARKYRGKGDQQQHGKRKKRKRRDIRGTGGLEEGKADISEIANRKAY